MVKVLIFDAFNTLFKANGDALPYVKEVITRLSEEYTLCVATDLSRTGLNDGLHELFGDLWKQLFKVTVTPDELGVLKPNTKFSQAILSELSVKPQDCVMIGDSWRRDLEPARELGITTVLISPSKNGAPDFHVTDYLELERVIKSLS